MDKIQNNEVYKQVLADSFGDVMYNVANRNKYNTSKLLQLWQNMSASEKESAGGIMKGTINFLQGN